MKTAIRILTAAKERNSIWMEKLSEQQKKKYIKENNSIDKAIEKLIK